MAVVMDIDYSRRLGLECIDDRGLVAFDEEGLPFVDQSIKTPAGPYGLAQDQLVARLTASPKNATELGLYLQNAVPLGRSAKIIAHQLGHSMIIASTHEACAAEEGIRTIAKTVVEKPDEILTDARTIHQGDITEEQYQTVAQAYGLILLSGLNRIFRGEDKEARCMDGPEYGGFHEFPLADIKRSKLANQAHLSKVFQTNHRKNTWFDTQKAYKEDPAYHADQWAVPMLAENIDLALPHDNIEGFIIANCIRTAATAHNLPREGDAEVTGLDIEVIRA